MEESHNKINDKAVSAIADYLIGACATAYYCDLNNKSCRVLQDAEIDDEDLEKLILNFDDGIDFYVSEYVHPDDQKMMREKLSVPYVRKALETSESFSFNYRETYHGKDEKYRGIVMRGDDDDHVVVFFLNISDTFSSEFEQAQIETEQRVLIENYERILALEDNLESIYDVNLQDGTYELFLKGRTFSEHVNTKMINNCDFFADTIKNAREVIYPEDIGGVLSVVNHDHIVKALEKENHIDWYYRLLINGEPEWVRLRILYKNSEKKHIIVGIFNAAEEVAVKQREEKIRDELVNQMVGDDGLFLIDCVNDTRKTIHDNCYGANNYSDSEKYSETFDRYVDKCVARADRPMVRELASASYMLERLKSEKEYSIEYRDISTGHPLFYEMRIARFSEGEVLQSFKEKNKEVIDRLIMEKLENDFFALFYIDIDNESISMIKNLSGYSTEDFVGGASYTKSALEFAHTLGGEPEKFFSQVADINVIRKYFMDEDKHTYSYKSKISNEWIEATGFVILRHDDGTPAMLALGFSLVDSIGADRQEKEVRLKEDMQMIGGLAGEYYTLYYINMDERIFKIYSLDGQKFPELMEIVKEDGDPFAMIRDWANELVHPDDRHLFNGLTIESLRNKLNNKKTFSLLFRRNYKGEYLWSKMDVIKYEKIGETANVVAVGFAEQDNLIRSEKALDNCLSILGKEISSDEAINELLALVGEFYSAQRAYIFEYGDNRETISNTFEWCSDGVDEMFEKLQSIPSDDMPGWIKKLNMITAPIMNEYGMVGFIGVENPSRAQNNLDILKNCAAVCYSEMLKRKQTEIALYESSKSFADTFMDSYSSAYYVNIEDGSFVVFCMNQDTSPKYVQEENYIEAMHKYIEESIDPEDRKMMLEMIDPMYVRSRLTQEEGFSVYFRDISSENVKWYQVDVTRGSDSDHIGVAFSDVTSLLEEERSKAKQLENALAEAKIASNSKTSFLFNMSHDIRTPMNAMMGFTTMAKKYIDDKEKVAEYLDKIDIAEQQLLSLINQVLEMARIESGKIEVENKPIDVSEKFNSMVTILSEQAQANGLQFSYALKNPRHLHVLADEVRMNSITINIVGNALKYTPEGGSIYYELEELPPRKEGFATYRFVVSDTGIGMSDDYLKEIFEPFSRAKNSTVSKIQGTGLGLAIVKNLVDLLGGDIKVYSKLGSGTRFEIVMDFAINLLEPEETDVSKKTGKLSFAGKRALLVEDNEMNREIAKDLLEENDILVEEAEDGDVAVRKVKQKVDRYEYRYYDWILMDVQMPRMNGYEATKEIRNMRTPKDVHIPIIAMTANAFEEDRQNALAAGMDEHLAKPIEIRKLLETLSRYI